MPQILLLLLTDRFILCSECANLFVSFLLSLSQLIVRIFCIVHCKQKLKNYIIHLFITWECCVSAVRE